MPTLAERVRDHPIIATLTAISVVLALIVSITKDGQYLYNLVMDCFRETDKAVAEEEVVVPEEDHPTHFSGDICNNVRDKECLKSNLKFEEFVSHNHGDFVDIDSNLIQLDLDSFPTQPCTDIQQEYESLDFFSGRASILIRIPTNADCDAGPILEIPYSALQEVDASAGGREDKFAGKFLIQSWDADAGPAGWIRLAVQD